MARWRLYSAHYLKVPGTEWEYREVSTETGRQARKIFEVPLYCEEGTIVSHEHSAQRGDVVFEGQPTPDMEPIDDEAQQITDQLSKFWQHPIESLPGEYGQSLINDLQRQIDALATQKGPAVSLKGAGDEEFAKLKAQVEALASQNSALLAELTAQRERRE